jgi:hypothetical protein
MVASKKTSTKKHTTPKKGISEQAEVTAKSTLSQKVKRFFIAPVEKIRRRTRGLLIRRPHRSFRRSQRRDYVRSLALPGYWAFTAHVRGILWGRRKLFALLVAVYAVLTVALVGIASQDMYTQLGDTLRDTSGEVFEGNWGEVGKASLLLISGVTGTINESLTPIQQLYATILVLFVWLSTVWLLRAILAGRKPKLRDGLYNSGAPILPTFLVGLLFVVQLLPIALALVGFGVAGSSGLLDSGIESMLFWTCAALLATLSLYWITSTLLALVVVTLPGMYPMQAIKTAGDLVVGRRIRILLRLLWLFMLLAVSWLAIMIPIILFDVWLKGIWPMIEWIPIVPAALLVMSTLTVVWSASYIYILYRKVVDDDAAPA